MEERTFEAVIDRLVEQSLANVNPQNCDYEKDDLLYCGVCNEPKQQYVELFHKPRKVGALCACQRAERERKEEEKKRRELAEKIAENRSRSGLSAMDAKKRFEVTEIVKDNETQTMYCRNYALKFGTFYQNGKGLLLYGPPGTGKSHMSSCIANILLDSGRTVKMVSAISVAALTSFQTAEEAKQYIREFTGPDLLILDDLGAERATSYAQERVHDLIEYRTNAGKPLIVTTNFSLDEMKNETDIRRKRTFDRLFGCCFAIFFAGSSYRRKMAGESFAEMKKLLED